MRDMLLTERRVDDLDLVQHVADLFADASEILFAEVLLLNALILAETAVAFLAGKFVDACNEFFRDYILLSFLCFI